MPVPRTRADGKHRATADSIRSGQEEGEDGAAGRATLGGARRRRRRRWTDGGGGDGRPAVVAAGGDVRPAAVAAQQTLVADSVIHLRHHIGGLVRVEPVGSTRSMSSRAAPLRTIILLHPHHFVSLPITAQSKRDQTQNRTKLSKRNRTIASVKITLMIVDSYS